MAHGRKTGGRQKGTPNKKTREMIEAVASEGITPLAYMLRIMRDEGMDVDARFEAAKAAAPYIHPKLSNIEHRGDKDAPLGMVFITRDAD